MTMQATLPLSGAVPVPMPTGSLEAYIQTVNRYPILSAEDERALAQRFQQQGDLEAARSLGMSRWRVFRLVALPIALRYAFPGICNMWMVVVKNTPFVSAIGLEDLVRAAGTAGENTKQFFTFYLAVLVSYLLLSAVSMLVQSAIDRRLFRHLAVRGV